MGVLTCCPVVLVELGIGWIRAVHADGRAKVEIGRFQGLHACMHYTSRGL